MTEPPDYTNRYNTPLAPGEKPAFKAWLDQLSRFKKHDAAKEMFDYDLQGAFKAGETPDDRGHLDDRFKKPNHTTFSTESIYSTPDNPGGQWLPHRPGRWDYQASPANLKARSPAQLQDYFRQYEPNSRLYLPKEAAMPVGYTNRTFDPGNFGIGSLAQLGAQIFARGRGANPQAEPSMKGVLGFDPAATAAAPATRNYLGSDVASAQQLIKSMVPQPPPERMAGGPSVPMSKPGMQQAGYIGGGKIAGPGDGRSDSVPAMVDGQGMAQLSTDEYVVPADVVSALGRGSSAAGAKKLDAAIQQVRSGYATKLKGMKAPKAGGGKKFLGGLFQTEQESDIQLPDYLRDVAGSIPGRISSYEKARPSAVSEIAKFTPDQLAFFQRSRQAAGDVTGAQGAYQRGQDLLGGIYQGGDPWSDKLIEASMADYDRGTAIDAAGRRRSAAGRGAFGEGTQLAEVEAGREAARGRGLLGEQLREQGLSRRTQAAQQIGSLAGLERQANIGDLGLLGGIGEIEYGRAQKVAEAPWQKVARINSLLQGAPTSTTQTTTESPLKMMIGAAAAGAAAAMKSGGRVRAGGRASHRKRADDRFYADGGVVEEEPTGSEPTTRQRAKKALGGFGLQLLESYAGGGRIPIPRSKPKPPQPPQEDTAKGLETLDRVMASQQDRLDLRMPEPHVPDSGDENEIIGGLARFGRPPPRGAPLHGRRQQQLADGGQVAPGAFRQIAPDPSAPVSDWRSELASVGDWTSGTSDRIAQGLRRNWRYLTEGGLGPEPYESPGGGGGMSDAAKRVAELVGAPAPDAVPAPTAPVPVSKPARKGGSKKAGPTTVATASPLLAAPGVGALPARLSSPDTENPITAAPPSPPAPGIKVTELPPPPKTNASPEAKQSWFDRWSSNPLTQFGLAMMASPTGQSVGQAIGSAGIAAISGAAAGRKESREEQRLALADKREQDRADREEKADVRAMMKIGLDEEQAKEVAANNREQRRQADERLKLEQQRIDATVRHYGVREGQMAEGLNIRRQALAKSGAGKAAADPNKVVREGLQKDLVKALHPETGDPATAEALRQAIAALGPAPAVDTSVPPPEGALIDDAEE